MASTVLGVAGAVIGGAFFGQPQLGYMIGSALGAALFPPPGADGPRLADLSVQKSTYGSAIPIVWGKYRLTGNIIWATQLVEHANEADSGSGGGGATNYTYTCSFAVLICEGRASVTRMWADGKLIYDLYDTKNPVKFTAGGFVPYTGTENQMPDPTIEADKGVGNVPAYRGTAYAVFTDLELGKYGNRIPNLSFEVAQRYGFPVYVMVGGKHHYDVPPVKIGVNAGNVPFTHGAVCDPFDDCVYFLRQTGTAWYIDKANPHTRTMEGTIALLDRAYSSLRMALHPLDRVIRIIVENDTLFFDINLATFTRSDGTTTYPLADIAYTANAGFIYLNYTNQGDTDDWGCIGARFGGDFILCGNYVAVVTSAQGTSIPGIVGGSVAGHLFGNRYQVYDPLRERLIALTTGGYFDFRTGEEVTIPFGGNPFCINPVYDAATDRIYGAEAGNIIAFDPSTFSTTSMTTEGEVFTMTAVYADGSDVDASYGLMPVVLPGMPDKLCIISGIIAGSTDDVFLTYKGKRETTLAQIVRDISLRTPLLASEIDVTQLTDSVTGYCITNNMAARSAIEPLMQAYFFDNVESDEKIKFVKRGGMSVATIPTTSTLLDK